MGKSLHARLVAYRPFGARIGVLVEPVSFSASMLHNDDGAISIEYSMLSGDAQAFDRELTDGLEVAVEVSDGTGYREPDNARFVITGRSGKTDDRTRTVTYSGQSISWLLSKAENNDSSHLLTDGDNKGKRPFYSSNPGVILKTLLDENKARGGVATGLSLGFDTAKDAGGAAWARKYTLYYSLGTDLQTILSSLVNGGGCDWRTTGRTLKMWNADSTALSRDLSKSIVLQLARDISEAPFEESIADLASTILVEGDNNLLFRMDNPAAPTPWGKWESYSSQGGVSDKDTAQAFMQSTLADAARVRGQYTRDLIVSDVDNLPLVDFHAGDWITAPTVSHGEKVRLQEIDLSMRQNEGLSCSIALNDIKYDASVRQAKKIKGITGGAALAGSEGGTTASSDRDHRVPKAPLGLIVQTDSYIGSDGYAHGLATAMWGAVTQATNDTAIEIGSYAVEWRKHVDGAPWHSAGTTDKTQLGFGGLDCGTQIEVRVRAVPTYSDQLGEWSSVFVATVESDTTPCSVPSKPVLSSELGVVTIHWDGRTAAGASMEPDFDHIEVGEDAATAGMQVISATQAGKGDYVVTGLNVGGTHRYALRSVDHAGNKSGWSSIASVTVASAVPQETLDSINQDIAKAEAEAKAAKTTADGKNRIFAQMYEPTHSGLRAGDLWYELDRDGHIGSVHVWNGWSFAAYTLVADSLLVPGSVDGGVLIKDGSIEAKNVHIGNGEILTELLKARKIVTDDVEAGQFRGYVFTGSVFQSSEMEDTGLKLDSASLRMWDSNHNQTVYLDGEGKSNLLTGTFQTRASGHRLRISPDYKSATIGGTETFVGDGLEFPAYDSSNGAYHSFPAVASVVQSDEVGTMSAMNLWSGHVNKNDPAAFMRLNSKPRDRGGTGSGGVTSEVFAVANTDYDEPDASKKTSASLVLAGDSANGSNAWLRAQDANGTVGVGANIATGYLYLGGFLGGVTNRFTFRGAVAWKAWWPNSGSTIATGASTQVNCTFSPAKFGRYYVVANADSEWAGIIAHPCNTGGQSGFQLKLYNADRPCPVEVWAEYLAYLVK